MRQIFDSKEFLNTRICEEEVFGAIYAENGTTFRVWAPTAEAVTLNLYYTGSDTESGAGLIDKIAMQPKEKGVWYAYVDGCQKGRYYTYTVCIDGKETETADVYTKACGVNGERSMVVDLRETDPENFRDNTEWLAKRRELAECPVIYELHVKDFSSDGFSGICEEHQGKYLAFTHMVPEKGEVPVCISHLKKLGVTHIHILPFFDYGSVDESGDLKTQFNWGYDPVHYNVPEGSYSTDPYHGEVRIRECKQMIQALHNAGIAVVMDVVFNHTYSLESVFQHTVPDYYYRKNEDGTFANGSICGNDTASEREMFRKYMIESVCYWAEEYQMDGFRFDLMGLHDVETMNQIREALDKLPEGQDILMYGEPWSGDYSPMREGSVPAMKEFVNQLHNRIAVFCDKTRDTIKGDVFIAREPGFVNGETGLDEEVKDCVCAWCRREQKDFTPKNQGQVITYISAHDNYTLWDKLCLTLPENAGKKCREIDFSTKNPQVLRQNKMAAAMYFTCLGTVFFQAGEEFGRTKQGLENSYNASPEINALSWKHCQTFSELTEFYKGLISFRKQWKEFYGRTAKDIQIDFAQTDKEGLIAFQITKPESSKALFVIYNQNKEKAVLQIPKGEWKIICNGEIVEKEMEKCHTVAEQIIVKNQAVMILGKENIL